MASSNNERFSARAAAWDSNPFVHTMSDRAWATIQKYVPTVFEGPKKPNVLEVGCGTGLLSLQVATRAERLVAVDDAEGMIAALKTKLAMRTDAPTNILPVNTMLEDPEDENLPPAEGDGGKGRLKFDLVISHLVLHHIPDLESTLRTMLGCLQSGTGWIALTDFEDFGSDARKFHAESKMDGVVRHGVKAADMAALMRNVGFVDVDVRVGWTSNKTVEKFPGEFGDGAEARTTNQGMQLEFPFLICLGRRAGDDEDDEDESCIICV